MTNLQNQPTTAIDQETAGTDLDAQIPNRLVVDATGHTLLELDSGAEHQLRAEVGFDYRLVLKTGGLPLADDLIAERIGDDLVVTFIDGTQLVVIDYYLVCAPDEPVSYTHLTLPTN